MVTTFNQTLNTYSSDSFPEGTIPNSQAITEFTDWAEALDIRETPLQARISKGSALNQPIFYFGQSFVPERESTVQAGSTGTVVGSNSGTKLTVASGHGVRFQPTHVLGIYDTGTNDIWPVEQVWVESIAGDVLTVVRAIDGGSASSTIAATDRVVILGTAEVEGKPHNLSPVTRGTRNYNYFQTFNGGVKATWKAQNTPTHEQANHFLNDLKQVTGAKKWELEQALWYGHRALGDPDATSPTPALMAGIDQLLVTNRTNLSGGALTKRGVENALYSYWTGVRGALSKQFVCTTKTKRIIDTFINPVRRTTMETTVAGTTIERVITAMGEYTFEVMDSCPEGALYLLDMQNIILHPYKGNDWHMTEKPGKYHGADVDEKYISGTFSLELRKEQTMGVIYGFDVDLDNYPDVDGDFTLVSA